VLRILCYKKENENVVLIGKGALEVGSARLIFNLYLALNNDLICGKQRCVIIHMHEYVSVNLYTVYFDVCVRMLAAHLQTSRCLK
jgi:hypothetical protein